MKVNAVVKDFGSTRALDGISFTIQPRAVTALLGPNGSGKTTLLRIALGLLEPTSGQVFWSGRTYKELEDPLFKVGAHLEASFHPGRSAFNHLWAIAITHGISKARVREALAMVGLGDVAKKRVGTFSLGMRQRLGLAGALLGNPQVCIFDEPTNGLDLDGILWFRQFVTQLVAEGRTVLFSSHTMSEVSKIANDVVILGEGKLLFHGAISSLLEQYGGGSTDLEDAYRHISDASQTHRAKN